MRKILCAVILIVFVTAGCGAAPSGNSADGYYKFNRSGITEITAASQMSNPVKTTVISKENADRLLNRLEELKLQPENTENDLKGRQYLFSIKYEDESTVQITLSEETVIIGGTNYETDLYKAENFSEYFE